MIKVHPPHPPVHASHRLQGMQKNDNLILTVTNNRMQRHRLIDPFETCIAKVPFKQLSSVHYSQHLNVQERFFWSRVPSSLLNAFQKPYTHLPKHAIHKTEFKTADISRDWPTIGRHTSWPISFLILRHPLQGWHLPDQQRALFHSSTFNRTGTFYYLLQQIALHSKMNDWQ